MLRKPLLAALALAWFAAAALAQTPPVPLGPSGGGGSSGGGGGGGAVSSVSNGDGTLTISPTTGSVVGSLALAHANTWTPTTGIGIQATGRAAFNLMSGPNGGSTVPVPTLYPATNNTNLALDLSPHGVPTDLGYGVAWNDTCTTDQIQFGSSATACLHISAGLSPSRLDISSAEYTAGTLLPLYFGTFNGDTPAYTDTFVINTDATYQELNGVSKQIRTVTAAGAVTVAKTDHVVCINKTVGAATTANLFASPRVGTDIIIKDCKGDAATNPITVTPAAGNIDASATFVINSNYGSWEGVYNGAAWSTVPLSGGSGSGVTSVGFTGGLISVGTPTTTPALTVAGTSGGIPYFTSATTWATSGLLSANAIMIGGGAGTAPSTTTTGTGVLTALGVNIGSAGSVVVNGGALATPSSGNAANLTGLPPATGIANGALPSGVTINNANWSGTALSNANLANPSTTVNGATCTLGSTCAPASPAIPLTVGTSGSITGSNGYYVCTGTCSITLPTPAAGAQFCIRNDSAVVTVITIAAITSVLFEKTTYNGYGTVTTGTMVSGGALGDKICLVGRDATHYLVGSFVGTWTNS